MLALRADAAGIPRLAVFALLMPPYLATAWGLAQLSGFCARLVRGEQFSRAAAAALKRCGAALIVAAALLPASRLAARCLAQGGMQWDTAVQSLLGIMPILATAFGVIIGLIVIVFAAILEQAAGLAEENARFI
jgi:hypothetical protein